MKNVRPIVNPQAVEVFGFDSHPDYTCIWDMCALPDGDVYTSLCTEGMPAGLNAILFRLPAGSHALEEIVSNGWITHQDTKTGIMPHSKIHTTLQHDASSGKLYYCTYTTSPGLGHEFWDVTQLHDDPAQGYPGSHFVVYDLKRRHAESWGIPSPRHMIYGGILDVSRRRYYYLTSLNGRLGYVDLEARFFVDVGRVSRRAGHDMFLDPAGNLYGLTREGQFWRYSPEAHEIALLNLWVPRRYGKGPEAGEVFLHKINSLPDGSVIGICRGTNPFWRFVPPSAGGGRDGMVANLGNPWPDLEDGSRDTGWIPLRARDGWIYYWTRTTKEDSDIHLVRFAPDSGERQDLGLGHLAGKAAGTWMGPGAAGADGRLYWGNSSYEQPRVIAIDPAKASAAVGGVAREIEIPPSVKTPTGTSLTVHPVNPAWSDAWTPAKALRSIPVCGCSAPHGSCAITSLACPRNRNGMALALTSGRSCRLITYEPQVDQARTRLLFDTGIAGCAANTLAVGPGEAVIFSLSPAAPGEPAPVYRGRLDAAGNAAIEAIFQVPKQGVRALTVDWQREMIQLLTTGNTVLRLTLQGERLGETAPLCDRQLSPALVLANDGTLYGAARGGRIWRLDPRDEEIALTGMAVPCQKGRAYCVTWESSITPDSTGRFGSSFVRARLARAKLPSEDGSAQATSALPRDEKGGPAAPRAGKSRAGRSVDGLPEEIVFGGSSDGYLFEFDPRTERLRNLGKPLLETGLRALAAASDGTIYGAGGEPGWGIVRLFRYAEQTGFADLGQPDSKTMPYGWALRIACAAAASDGTIFFGEDDDLSHLWAYRPTDE